MIKTFDEQYEDFCNGRSSINESEPTRTEEYVENGMKFIRLIWETPQGSFIKTAVVDILPEVESIESLRNQLTKAVDSEDYSKAIVLRDEIKKRS
jgi:hypothetical protein